MKKCCSERGNKETQLADVSRQFPKRKQVVLMSPWRVLIPKSASSNPPLFQLTEKVLGSQG